MCSKKSTNGQHIVHFKTHQIGNYSYLNGVVQKGICEGKIIAYFFLIFVLLPLGFVMFNFKIILSFQKCCRISISPSPTLLKC